MAKSLALEVIEIKRRIQDALEDKDVKAVYESKKKRDRRLIEKLRESVTSQMSLSKEAKEVIDNADISFFTENVPQVGDFTPAGEGSRIRLDRDAPDLDNVLMHETTHALDPQLRNKTNEPKGSEGFYDLLRTVDPESKDMVTGRMDSPLRGEATDYNMKRFADVESLARAGENPSLGVGSPLEQIRSRFSDLGMYGGKSTRDQSLNRFDPAFSKAEQGLVNAEESVTEGFAQTSNDIRKITEDFKNKVRSLVSGGK